MNYDDLKYWIALKSIEGVGQAIFHSLLDRFHDPSDVFSVNVEDLSEVSGISPKIAMDIVSFNDWEKIDVQLNLLDKMNAHIVTCRDDSYPQNLLNVYDRPAFLYVSGNLLREDINIAIVGSRQASAYGRYTTEKISRELSLKGITIISGMARGIDSCAHRGALSVQGRTIAVLGSGLDVIYPPENEELFNVIVQNGAIVSEYPPGTQPLPHHFPARNRIISGMSWGVLVVEAGKKSGSLITARLAADQGREVFAIPGPIDSSASSGTNSLIKQGAKLIEDTDDILDEILPQLDASLLLSTKSHREMLKVYEPIRSNFQNTDILDDNEKTILRSLSQNKIHVDDIILKTGLPPGDVLSILIKLELKDFILQHHGKFFSIKK